MVASSARGVGHEQNRDQLVELATFGVMGFACLPCAGLIKEILGRRHLPQAWWSFYVIGVIPFILADKHPGWQWSGTSSSCRGRDALVLRLLVCVFCGRPAVDKRFERDRVGLGRCIHDGSLEVALLSHAFPDTSGAVADEYRRACRPSWGPHAGGRLCPDTAVYRLTQRLAGSGRGSCC